MTRAVEALRNRQVKNFLTLTLLAQGTPMLLMGDEVRRTQRGNNNAYCHDDETSWFDWTLLERHGDVRRFVERLVSHRLHLVSQLRWHDYQTLADFLREARIQIHGVKLDQPDWSVRISQPRFHGTWAGGRDVSHHDQCLPGGACVRASAE